MHAKIELDNYGSLVHRMRCTPSSHFVFRSIVSRCLLDHRSTISLALSIFDVSILKAGASCNGVFDTFFLGAMPFQLQRIKSHSEFCETSANLCDEAVCKDSGNVPWLGGRARIEKFAAIVA